MILVEKLEEPCLQNEPLIVLANGNLQGLLKVEISLNKLRADWNNLPAEQIFVFYILVALKH